MPDSMEGFRYVKAESKGFTEIPKKITKIQLEKQENH